MRIGLVLCALALGGCVSTAAAQQGAPDWMRGYWLACADGRETIENWIGAGEDVMLGANITRGGRVSYEFLRIARNDGGAWTYFAMPDGRAPATEFVMAAHANGRVVFENTAHDFPQRVIYAREGDVLIARIEGAIDGRAESAEWRFRRAAADARCPR